MGSRWGYSLQIDEKMRDKIAIASGRDLDISWKEAREICKVIKGMKLYEAMRFLEDVIKHKQAVPYYRYHGKVAHKRGLGNRFKVPFGRYPEKAAKAILKVLKNVENNALIKGLDPEKCVIIHACAHRAHKIKGIIYRAFGRATPWDKKFCHVEIAVMER